jgi:hypothetical protein
MTLGGFSGGSEPNNISVSRFRNIAGCCGATGPEALNLYWQNTISQSDNCLTLNFLHNYEGERVAVTTDYPVNNSINISIKEDLSLSVRLPGYCDGKVELYCNDKPIPLVWRDSCVSFGNLTAGDSAVLKLHVPETEREEIVKGIVIKTKWLGNTVTDITPGGTEYPLFNRQGGKRPNKAAALKATK